MKKKQSGITLIALVITIIILLILAGMTIVSLTQSGLFEKAKEAKEIAIKAEATEDVNLAINKLQIENATRNMTQEEKRADLENELKKYHLNSTVTINGTNFIANHKGYKFEISDNLNVSIKGQSQVETENWDDKAAPEDVFVWKSDDPNDPGYGVVVGYTAKVDSYTTLRFPTRCTSIELKIYWWEDERYTSISQEIRSYVQNIKEVELPSTVTYLGNQSFNIEGYYFTTLEKINIPNSVVGIDYTAFEDLGGHSWNSEAIYEVTFEVETDSYADAWLSLNKRSNWVINYTEKIADVEEVFNAEEWDKNATPEDVFLWESDDPNNEGYGVIIGYKSGIQGYSKLKYPSRCRKITLDSTNTNANDAMRSYTQSIRCIELPETITEIGNYAFSENMFANLVSINIPDSVTTIGTGALEINSYNFKIITIPDSVIEIGNYAFSGNIKLFYVYKNSYADTWLQTNKNSDQTITYITE